MTGMKDQLQFFILGIVLILGGLGLIFKPVYYSSRFLYTFDYSEIKWFLGGILVVLGAYFLKSSYKRIKGNRK